MIYVEEISLINGKIKIKTLLTTHDWLEADSFFRAYRKNNRLEITGPDGELIAVKPKKEKERRKEGRKEGRKEAL